VALYRPFEGFVKLVNISGETINLPSGVFLLQIFDTLTVVGSATEGLTSRCVQTQSFSKKAPPNVWILPISNHRPEYYQNNNKW
jgi:hypothetical protein